MTTHTLSVLVENKAGVLVQVAGLFSRRGFNITSLSVGPTADDRISRMTIVVDGATTPIEQVHRQLEKLVRVLKVSELYKDQAVERELALIKVTIDPAMRAQLLDVAASYRANVVDLDQRTLVLEAVCSPGKLQSLLASLVQHGTCELVRTGLIAIARGSDTITDDLPAALRKPADTAQGNIASLVLSQSHQDGALTWQPCITTTTPISVWRKSARSRCWDTGRRGMRMH